MGIDPEFPDLIFERLSGNAQFRRSTSRAGNQTPGLAEHTFDRRFFALGKAHDWRGARESEVGAYRHEPSFIHSESFPIAQNHCPLDDTLQLANVAWPVIRSEQVQRLFANLSDFFTSF